MIALDKILNNTKEYGDYYKSQGLDSSMKFLLKCDSDRKSLESKIETLKAETNRLCYELAQNKIQKADMKFNYNNIVCHQKIMDNLMKLEKFLALMIDDTLEQLPNLPDYFTDTNEVISNFSGSETKNFKPIEKFLEDFHPTYILNPEATRKDINYYLSSLKDYVLGDGDSLLINSPSAAILLVPDYNIDLTIENLINFLSLNSMELTRIKTSNLKPTSSAEYVAKINNELQIKIEVKREFFTRKYKIKYRNNKIDMTKFMNQINIIYKNSKQKNSK